MKKLSWVLIAALIFMMLAACGSTESASGGIGEAVKDVVSAFEEGDGSYEAESEASGDDNAEALSILEQIPYFGDISKCTMTAEQAAAYAQLIADGIAGKLEKHDYYGEIISDAAYWEDSFQVRGYDGVYETNRALIMLGDFAGDGNPYVYVRSSLVDYASYDVYGWDGESAQWAYGDEGYHGRGSSYLSETDDGKVVSYYSGSGGATYSGGETYSFVDGTAEITYKWELYWDTDRERWVKTENGEITKEWTEEEWMNDDGVSTEEPERTASYAPFSEVEANACALREMIDSLNQYAEVLGGDGAVEVTEPEIETAQNDDSAMAQAMLDALNSTADLQNALLYDMDGDGIKELIICSQEQYWGFACDVYQWKNNTLNKVIECGGGLNDEVILVKDSQTGEYGIRTAVYTDATIINIYFLTYSDGYREEWGEYDYSTPNTYYDADGNEITQSEFDSGVASYAEIEQLDGYASSGRTTVYYTDETKAELNSMLAG